MVMVNIAKALKYSYIYTYFISSFLSYIDRCMKEKMRG